MLMLTIAYTMPSTLNRRGKGDLYYLATVVYRRMLSCPSYPCIELLVQHGGFTITTSKAAVHWSL